MKKTLSLGKEDHSDGTLTGKEGKIRVLIQNIVKHLHLVGRPTQFGFLLSLFGFCPSLCFSSLRVEEEHI